MNSSRHHYIPQFFIKNFTDEDGFLYIYNKLENRISNRRQSPKSIFFEEDRNTIDFGGIPLDNLEKLYAELDSKISPDLRNILATKSITPEELTSIIFLASLLKWRIPSVDERFNIIKNDLSQKDLGISITIKDKKMVDKEAIKHLETSDIFNETKRILLGILPLRDPTKLLDIYNNSFIQTNTFFPSLLGDYPIIEEKSTLINELENFIFPLSSTNTFIYKQDCKKVINSSLFFIQRDLAVLESSWKYIGCRSKEHLEKVVQIYNEVKKNHEDGNICKHLFRFIT